MLNILSPMDTLKALLLAHQLQLLLEHHCTLLQLCYRAEIKIKRLMTWIIDNGSFSFSNPYGCISVIYSETKINVDSLQNAKENIFLY